LGDAHGLGPFYKELALRFAQVGITAIAIDYYGRTAGLAPREASFEFRPHLNQLTLSGLFIDTAAALAYLRTGAGSKRATFTLGFCMGGALAFMTGATDAGLAGAIGLYAYTGKLNDTSFLERAEQITCPVLGLFGEADQVIPVSDVHVFDEKLDKTDVAHEIILYPGAPHGFFEMQQTAYAEASADAWKRVLGFMAAYTP
jgi:carboxymethylenebutenolidase